MLNYELFRELRKKNHYSQKKIADILDVSRSAVSMWEIGKSQPDTEMMAAIAKLFGVSTDSLLGVDTQPPTIDEQLSEIDFALYGEVKELTDEQKQDILDYARFKKEQWKKEK